MKRQRYPGGLTAWVKNNREAIDATIKRRGSLQPSLSDKDRREWGPERRGALPLGAVGRGERMSYITKEQAVDLYTRLKLLPTDTKRLKHVEGKPFGCIVGAAMLAAGIEPTESEMSVMRCTDESAQRNHHRLRDQQRDGQDLMLRLRMEAGAGVVP